jgi:hypothetical protein
MTAGVPARRHGVVDIICNVSARLNRKLLAQQSSRT